LGGSQFAIGSGLLPARGRRNSHYADGSRIRPRNGSPARIGLRLSLMYSLTWKSNIGNTDIWCDDELTDIWKWWKISNVDLCIMECPLSITMPTSFVTNVWTFFIRQTIPRQLLSFHPPLVVRLALWASCHSKWTMSDAGNTLAAALAEPGTRMITLLTATNFLNVSTIGLKGMSTTSNTLKYKRQWFWRSASTWLEVLKWINRPKTPSTYNQR
jgi:hypothetical protein